MKIVIDIPEDVYTRLFDNGIQDNEIATGDICKIARSIRLGILLPKGHGDLIILSNDELKENRMDLSFSCQKWISEAGLSFATVAIIEAESEEKE